MKLIASLAIALVAASEKKVPPRNPEQRLNTLKRFFGQFAETEIEPRVGAGYAGRLQKRMEGMCDSMLKAYQRPQCGYFDPSHKHGGPDANPDLRPNGKPRNRRDAGDETYFDDQETFEAECAKGWDNNSAIVRGECCEDVASYAAANADNCSKLPAVRRKGNKKTPWDRLSQDPELKWKQIMTGCRKWADRYINECGGQRKNQLIKNRTKKVYGKVQQKLGWA